MVSQLCTDAVLWVGTCSFIAAVVFLLLLSLSLCYCGISNDNLEAELDNMSNFGCS